MFSFFLLLKDEQRNIIVIHVGIFFVTVNTFTSKGPTVCCSDNVYLKPVVIPVAMRSFVTSVVLMSYIGDVFCRWQNWLNSVYNLFQDFNSANKARHFHYYGRLITENGDCTKEI